MGAGGLPGEQRLAGLSLSLPLPKITICPSAPQCHGPRSINQPQSPKQAAPSCKAPADFPIHVDEGAQAVTGG